MLVLSRTVGQVVVLRLDDGREIRVAVSAFTSGQSDGRSVRLAIDAPKDVVIFREEMREVFAPGTTTRQDNG